jgi:hypothetical protein
MSEDDNIVRLPVVCRTKDDPPKYEYEYEKETLPVVPAEPGLFLVTYFADKDYFGQSPIVAWRIGPDRAHPVTPHCQLKGASTAIVDSDHKTVRTAGGWFKTLQEWKEAMRAAR